METGRPLPPALCQPSPGWWVLCWVGALRGLGAAGGWPWRPACSGPPALLTLPSPLGQGWEEPSGPHLRCPFPLALQPLQQAGRDQGRVSVFVEAGPQEDRQPERAERGRWGQGGPAGPGRICPPLGLQPPHLRPDGQQRKGAVSFGGSSASGTDGVGNPLAAQSSGLQGFTAVGPLSGPFPTVPRGGPCEQRCGSFSEELR